MSRGGPRPGAGRPKGSMDPRKKEFLGKVKDLALDEAFDKLVDAVRAGEMWAVKFTIDHAFGRPTVNHEAQVDVPGIVVINDLARFGDGEECEDECDDF